MEKEERTNTGRRVAMDRCEVKLIHEEIMHNNSSMNKLKTTTEFQK
jgi:hypothetical protein